MSFPDYLDLISSGITLNGDEDNQDSDSDSLPMDFGDASEEDDVIETILMDENGKQKSVWDQQWC